MKKQDGGHGMNRREFLKVGMTGAAASLAFAGLGGSAVPSRLKHLCTGLWKDGPQDNDPRLRRHVDA